jgi:hypothetical protein
MSSVEEELIRMALGYEASVKKRRRQVLKSSEESLKQNKKLDFNIKKYLNLT